MTRSRSSSFRRGRRWPLAWLAAASLFMHTAEADELFEPLPGVVVDQAVATPAKAGGTSRLRFRIDNASGRDIALVGVRSDAAASGALIVMSPDGKPQEGAIFLLREEELLDLGSSHAWAELRGMRRSLPNGGTLEFELIFRTGAVPGYAHVHGQHMGEVQ